MIKNEITEKNRWIIVALFRCILVFHSPDGSELVVQSDAIKIIRPVLVKYRNHLAAGTNSLLYLGIRPVGVAETTAEAQRMIKECGR